MAASKHNKFTIEYLLEILLLNGLVGQEQAAEIRGGYLAALGRRPRSRVQERGDNLLGSAEPSSDPLDYIVSLKLLLPGDNALGRTVDDDIMARLMAAEAGLPYRRVEQRDLDLELITSILPQSFASRHLVLPLGLSGQNLEVAVRHPFYDTILEDVRRVSGQPTSPVIVPSGMLKKLIGEVYTFRGTVAGAESLYSGGSRLGLDIGNLEQFVKLKSAAEIAEDDQHIKNLVDYLLSDALANKASDIHIEPKRNELLVRMRFDGVLHDVYHLPKVLHPAVTSRIKTISRLDIAEKRRPQDGRIKIAAGKSGEAEVRVSTVPVAFGEKTVMRILDPEALFMELSGLFHNPADLEKWNSFMTMPHGIILVTGPTGSGKTTTLYSTLRQLATPAVNVTTVEDPIEMVHEEFNQIAVQPKIGITFGNIIRNILRQDPDIIMIGEMRDAETAENAIQAALTGHLVLSTLHTNDAPSAVTRLIDLGMEPFLVSSTLVGIMAQRLVRRICKYCVDEFVLTQQMAMELGFITQGDLTLKRGRGCEMCRNTGYLGRLATVEVMPMSESLKELTLKEKIGALEFKSLARQEGMTTLRENALDLMLAGLTTIEEVLRVTAPDE
ncbi:type II secretion system protein E [Deltaproteobacteria bacterium Smac51]|nr:type II secretion system protein E [Deltaproteobacteria bacterium Smac51]